MVRAWRRRNGRGVAVAAVAGIADELGILPCNALGCAERTGVACDHIDRRGRFCVTAWCPDHRHTLNDRAYCAIHAAQATGMLPIEREPAAVVVTWCAAAAEDDVASILNAIGARIGAITEAESMKATADAQGNRVWQRSWCLRGTDGVVGRVALSTNEAAVEWVHLSVDDCVIRAIALPALSSEQHPQRADLDWLMHEVFAPISAAVGVRAGGAGEADLAGTAHPAARSVTHGGGHC